MLQLPYMLFPVGDAALTIDLGNRIHPQLNQKIIAMQQWLQQHAFIGLKDVVVAYSSLTLLYDAYQVKKHVQPTGTVLQWVKEKLETAYQQSGDRPVRTPVLHRIPVCYEGSLAPDLQHLATGKGLDAATVIALHTALTYRVYMIGFLPGFAYMGEVDERIATPRRQQPVTVLPGSVGIAGSQTGIYPLQSPGGWNIIGRTPVPMFNPLAAVPVQQQPGDEVQFYPISLQEFEKIKATQQG